MKLKAKAFFIWIKAFFSKHFKILVLGIKRALLFLSDSIERILMFSFSIWDFLDAKTIAIGILALLLAYFYYENKSLKSEIEIINLKNLHLQGEVSNAKGEIDKQNEALKELEIQTQNVDLKALTSLKELEKIEVEKNSTCESELKSFKELFSVLGNAK